MPLGNGPFKSYKHSNKFTMHTFVIKYGIIFYVTSNSGEIFMLGKKIVTIMAHAQLRTSCTSLCKQLDYLSIPCQFIYTQY